MRLIRRETLWLLSATVAIIALGFAAWAAFLKEPPNYDRIEDGLYMGGRVESPPWRTRSVLNLCEPEDPYTCDVYEHRSIADAEPAPSLNWLKEQVLWIHAQRGAGRKVYVHCMNGVSRSGMVVTAYLMYEHAWSGAEALDFVRSKRAGVRPNPAFRPLLEEWEKELNSTRRVDNLPRGFAITVRS
jgi:hypothetical protein